MLLTGVGAALACSSARYGGDGPAPGVTLPAHFAEPAAAAQDAGPSASGATADAAPDAAGAPRTGYLPDPKPLSLARQWEYEVVYDRGDVGVVRVTERRFPQPVVTARRMGRYAIELWIGRELVDRVRFDFPLVAAEEVRSGPRRPLHEPPSFAEGAVFSQLVLVPASPRATRAVLVDRATGQTHELPWPPDAPLPPVGSDGSGDADGQQPRINPQADAGAAQPAPGPDAG